MEANDSTGVFAFVREIGDDRVWVAINRSDRPQKLQLPSATTGGFMEWLDPAATELNVPPNATERPKLARRSQAPGLTALGGVATIELPAYGTAVLTEAK